MTSSKLRGITVKPFVVALCAALFCSPLFATPNEWTGGNGDWNEPSNWSDGVPGESDAVVIAKKVTVTLTEAVKVASLTLSDSATLHVTAKPLAEVSVFDPQAYATEQERRAAVAAALWANRTIVEVTGAFEVDAGCTVQPENDKITGTPVVFKVGSASIAGTVNATGMGWGWGVLSEDSETRPDNVPAGALAQHGGGAAIKNVWLYTYAFGSGAGEVGNFGFAPLYGGTTAQNQTYVYGYPCAPFLPGSPSQFYSNVRNMRGGGAIVIHAAMSVSVSGLLEAIGKKNNQNAGCAGGSVWISAPNIVFADTAKICADGEPGYNGNQGQGGGGRVALTLIASEDELTTLVSGKVPSSMVVSDYVNPNVTATSPNGNIKGTVKWAASGCLQATLTTQSNVDGLIAAGVTWGDEVLLNGDYERTAPQYAFLADNPLIRYTCQGFVVSNKNGEVSSSDVELTASFTIDGSQGPYSLTWKWGDRQEIDPEPVSRRWVGGSSSQLMDPNNWEPAGVPTRVDELLVENAAVTASRVQVAKLVLSGGSLTLGSDAARENFEFSVSGDVTVCDGAVLNIYAPFKSDPADYTSVAAARELLWQNRTKFSVGGAFSVSEGATVRVDNHPETGDLVVFEVGAFDLAAGGTVTAAGTGFTWLPSAGKDLPTGTIMKTGTANIGGVYTFAFGAGSSYGTPADHSYGLDIAPFEPGSCGGAYSGTGLSRGGGSIVVFAKGAVTLNGTLNADSVRGSSYSGPSGGSIWITGATIDRGDGLVATARGQAEPTNGNYGIGAGGRVAFMTDVTTDEQIERMVGGEKLEGYTYETLSFEGLSVDSGLRNGKPSGAAGSAVTAFDASNYETVTVTASPLEAVSPLAKYGAFQTKGGETVVREADAIGGDPVNPQNVRYVCTGYVVSNATEQVAEGRTTTLSFPVVKGTGPYTVTWLWGIRQTRSRLSVTGPGTVTVNGQTVNELWIPDTEDVVFVATPDADKAFWTWSGDDVPPMDAAKTSFAILASKPHVVNAVFVDLAAAAKTSTLKATASGDFYNPMNWESEVVPNPQDAIAIPGGACKVLGRFACASLTMSGGSLSIAQAEEAVISGDVALSGGSVWTVTAVPTNTATAFADGATRVKIGGDLVMEDAVTVKPVSDPWTGGSVAFSVAGDFTLGEAAKFDAVGTGWGWVEYTGDPSPCAVDKTTVNGFTLQTMAVGRGNSFSIGGSYGGRGGSRPATGWTYGFANAPIHAGSPNGVHSVVGGYTTYCGGGLIRVHVGGLATVNGTLDASGPVVTSGGPSGGGVWLTAEEFAFGETAKLLAKGGGSGYSAQGGGGRIAIGTGLTAAQMASLKQTGACSRRAKDVELFKQDFPGVTVDVTLGVNCGSWATDGEDGTFSYYPTPKGLLLLVK